MAITVIKILVIVGLTHGLRWLSQNAGPRWGGLIAGLPSTTAVVLFLLNSKGGVPEGDYEIPFGRASVVREGTAATVVALAAMVPKAIQACERFEQESISIELIDPRTIAPLDIETILTSVRKTGRLLIADETFGPCGIGAEIAARVSDEGFDDLDAPIRRINGKHAPTPYSPSLEKAVVPSTDDVIHSIRELLAE